MRLLRDSVAHGEQYDDKTPRVVLKILSLVDRQFFSCLARQPRSRLTTAAQSFVGSATFCRVGVFGYVVVVVVVVKNIVHNKRCCQFFTLSELVPDKFGTSSSSASPRTVRSEVSSVCFATRSSGLYVCMNVCMKYRTFLLFEGNLSREFRALS